MGDRARILIVGDGAAPTGFARVIKGVFGPLAAKYDLHQLAINYWGDPHDWPVEAGPLAAEQVTPLQLLDRLVLYTQFGRKVIEEAARNPNTGALRLPPMAVIPHGIDTETFAPLSGGTSADSIRESRIRARQQLFPALPELQNAFIILNANRNQPRKRIDLTLEAFALFARDKPPDVKLFLHMGLEDFGWNIPTLGHRLGIYDRLIVTSADSSLPQEQSSYLNVVYNACDVGINTAMAEGWGLVAFEHAATGAAQIVPGFGVFTELWEGAAQLLPAGRPMTQEKTLMECNLIAPADAAMAMQRLYEDSAYRQRMTEAAYARATGPANQWAEISRQWDALFEEMLAERTRTRETRKRAPGARIRPPYIFLHIPKTGGTSLGELLGAHFGDAFEHYWAEPDGCPEGAERTCIIGHFSYGLHRLFGEPATYFTLLRNPATRVISQYFYNRAMPQDPWHQLARDHPLDEWLDLHPDANNLQVQFVSGRKGPAPTRATLDAAKRNLVTFGFVGIMEDFEGTLLLLRHALGVNGLQNVRLKESHSRPRLDEIAPATLEKVQRLNVLDFELYHFGQELFLTQLQTVGAPCPTTRAAAPAAEASPPPPS